MATKIADATQGSWPDQSLYYACMQDSDENPLLVRARTGQGKRSVRELPGSTHVYGLPLKRDEANAAVVLHEWKEHQPNARQMAPPCFETLNKASVIDGCVTAASQAKFREDHMLEPHFRRQIGRTETKAEATPYDPETRFGRKTVQSESVGTLIQNTYALESVKEQLTKNEENERRRIEERKIARQKKLGLASAAASRRKEIHHEEPEEEDPKGLWKHKKFNDVAPRVNMSGHV
eukprot:TRINITY_DN15007_c0_g1::TRINITY_DN15007_c0_g1_i1::g.25746::m.25746 TRINITY_DN15007_c0_g1::TRINITY_DN15007_c0_g1_i1::g.25746  ORF type:complete len:235 (-),score=55.79,DUF4483/PF14825.1/2.7e-37,Adeno_VII/PF03228.9/5e+02,Adeno_VII/PF03228.9/3 TRINITY_DN15007_c0_g1_i1:567-1271(-)